MANVYTDAGEALTADIIDGTTAAPTWYIGWGTGADTASKGDTTLSTEASETRVVATKSQPAADTNRFVGLLTCAGSGKTITNAGVLSAITVGTLFLFSDFSGLPLSVGDKIEFQFDLQWT